MYPWIELDKMCNLFVLYLCLIYTAAESVFPEDRECDISNQNVGIYKNRIFYSKFNFD